MIDVSGRGGSDVGGGIEKTHDLWIIVCLVCIEIHWEGTLQGKKESQRNAFWLHTLSRA